MNKKTVQPSERLQKVIADQGKGSRREIERWIEEGRIQLNGKVAKLGDRYKPGDRLTVDGKSIAVRSISKQLILGLMYYKPEGEVVTCSDEKARPAIFDRLPKCKYGRWISAGRLDLNTAGLILLTNNGELANRLMHPKYQIVREYAARVLGQVSETQISNMLRGVELEDGTARFETIQDAGGKGSNHWYHVSLREGRNREVRRIWESQDITVSRLIRIRFGSLQLDRGMKAGEYRQLSFGELNRLLNKTGLPPIKLRRTDKRQHYSALPSSKQTPRKARHSNKLPRKLRDTYRQHHN